MEFTAVYMQVPEGYIAFVEVAVRPHAGLSPWSERFMG